MIAHLKGRERALEEFGWPGRKAEWVALVSLHNMRLQNRIFLRTLELRHRVVRFPLIDSRQSD